jgi:sugar-specific transcriptional regulator TrmB
LKKNGTIGHDMESMQKQLEELGLNQHEVKAYLAALELGPATVMQIAAKAAIVRSTAHVAVGGLMKRGLMSSHIKGKKQYFQPQSPEILITIIEEEKKRLDRNQEKIRTLLPRLHALISVTGARPDVNYYEGMEGLQTMRAVLLSAKATELLAISSPEKYAAAVGEDSAEIHALHLEKSGLKIRQIRIFKKNSKPTNPQIRGRNFQAKILISDDLETSEIAIFGDYIALLTYLDRPYGFLIKSKEIASIASKLFEAAWLTARKRI